MISSFPNGGSSYRAFETKQPAVEAREKPKSEVPLQAMKMVVDKNFLELDELAVFLAMHPDNRAILIEFSAIEGYAGNAVKNIAKSMSVVCRFPEQTLVLKDARTIAGMGFIDPNLCLDLVEWKQTRGLRG